MSHATETTLYRPLPRQAGGFGLLHLLTVWHRRATGRSDLSRLDARGLKDVGISRFEAELECSKPFWQA